MKLETFMKQLIYQVTLDVLEHKLLSKLYYKDFVKLKKKSFIKNISNTKVKFYQELVIEQIQDMFMLNQVKSKRFQVKMKELKVKLMFHKLQLKFTSRKLIIQLVEVSHTYQLQDHTLNLSEDYSKLKFQKFTVVLQKLRAYHVKQVKELNQLCLLKIKTLILQVLVLVTKVNVLTVSLKN